MTNTVSRIINALPALSGDKLTYNAEKNLFLTNGYTSAAGNTYFRAIFPTENLVWYYNLGQGYAHLFLNGVTLYRCNGTRMEIIGSKNFNSYIFSETSARNEVKSMLADYFESQTKMLGRNFSREECRDAARQVVESAVQKRIS